VFAGLSSEDKAYVAGVKTLQEMLNMLKGLHEKATTLYALKDQLINLKWSHGQSAEIFISELSKLKSKIMSHQDNQDKGELDYIQKVLNELPTFMKLTKQHFTFKIRNKEPVSYRMICDNVIMEYNECQRMRKATVESTTKQ
jgi:hypothetical protein